MTVNCWQVVSQINEMHHLGEWVFECIVTGGHDVGRPVKTRPGDTQRLMDSLPVSTSVSHLTMKTKVQLHLNLSNTLYSKFYFKIPSATTFKFCSVPWINSVSSRHENRAMFSYAFLLSLSYGIICAETSCCVDMSSLVSRQRNTQLPVTQSHLLLITC